MSDQREILKQAKDSLDKAIEEVKLHKSFVKSVGPAIIELLKPVLDKIQLNNEETKRELVKAISGMKIEITPQVNLPPINVPQPKVTVYSPEVKVPDVYVPEPKVTVNVPKFEMPNNMEVALKGVSVQKPLPVFMVNPQGGPRGGLTLSDIVTPSGTTVMDSVNNAIRVNTVVGGGGGTQYNDTATPDQAGGIGTIAMLFDGSSTRSFRGSSYGIPTVQLSGFDGSLFATGSGEQNTNTLRVAFATDSNASVTLIAQDENSGPVSANTLRVVQAVDVGSSVNIIAGSIANTGFNITGQDENSGPVSASTLRVTQAVDVGNSVNVIQYGGNNVATGTEDGPGVLRVFQVQNAGNSVNVIADYHDTNQGATGANTLRVIHAGDIGASAKTIAVAMTTNPTAASDAADTFIRADKLGRLINTPVQVRQLRTTAYATLNSNTETTLVASPASTFLDLVYISFANTSTGTINIDLRSETGAGIVNTYAIPANATQGFVTPMPWPQNTAAATWTIKPNTADISNTTVFVNALFNQET